MPESRPDVAVAPRIRARRTLLVLLVAVVGLLGLLALAERAWFHRDLALDPPPASDPPPESRVGPSAFLLVIVDGLRETAVKDMPQWRALADEVAPRGGAGAASGIAIAGEPTMSATAIRAIVTGRSADLYTSFRDFTPVPVRSSVLDALAATNARIAHSGDGLLPLLCPNAYRRGDVLALPRKAFTSPTALDDFAFPDALEKAGNGDIDALTVHLVSVDLVGHAYSADGPEYAKACAEADDRVGQLVLAFRSEHTGAHVLVAADHGLSPRGTHGAGEPEARRAPFLLVGPRVTHRRGVVIPQTALAATVAALLHLPVPPLAETPAALALTRLRPEERVLALDAFLRARVAALESAGDSLGARGLDEARREAESGKDRAAWEPRLLRVVAGLLTPDEGPLPLLAALAAVALVAVLALLGARAAFPPARGVVFGMRGAAVAAAFVVAAVAVGAAGVAIQRTLLSAESVGPPRQRALVAGLGLAAVGLLAVGVFLARRRRFAGDLRGGIQRPNEKPDAIHDEPTAWLAGCVVAGGLLAALRSFRLAVNRAIHLPLLVGGLVVLACVVAAVSERDRARRAARWAFAAAVAAVVAATRAMDLLDASGAWDPAPPTRTASVVVVGLVLIAVAWIGSRVPLDVRRPGALGRTVLFVLLARVAVFHALGGVESTATIDPLSALVPGAAGQRTILSSATEFAPAIAQLVAREGLPYLVLLAAVARSIGKTGDRDGLFRLLAGLSLATASGAAILVAGAYSWSQWSWWMVIAVPVGLVALADAVVLAVAGVVATAFVPGSLSRRERAPHDRAPDDGPPVGERRAPGAIPAPGAGLSTLR